MPKPIAADLQAIEQLFEAGRPSWGILSARLKAAKPSAVPEHGFPAACKQDKHSCKLYQLKSCNHSSAIMAMRSWKITLPSAILTSYPSWQELACGFWLQVRKYLKRLPMKRLPYLVISILSRNIMFSDLNTSWPCSGLVPRFVRPT